jgi:hypothetical protein
MGESLKAHHLRQLMRTAHELRRSADSTNDAHYVGLFLRAAAAVEHRAAEIVNSPDEAIPGADTDLAAEAIQAAPEHVDLIV